MKEISKEKHTSEEKVGDTQGVLLRISKALKII